MNVLIIGSGGREHTIAWKISQSKHLSNLWVAPGNAGTAICATNIKIDIGNFHEIKDTVLTNEIDLIIIGPEDPLVNGLCDFFKSDIKLKDVLFFGPDKLGAFLEGSKDFAKEFMEKYNVPTAAYQTFTSDNYEDGVAFLNEFKPPYVLKADGLAAGKGVLICETKEQAAKELKEMLINEKFGLASRKVLVEQFLKGIELSAFVITDGDSYKILPFAKDYKRIGEGDTGLNTGGMGAISPVPFIDEALFRKIEDKIIKPTVRGLKNEGFDYKGFVFIGIMNVDGEPYVIEYNVRMGDPEAEVVIPRIKTDFLEVIIAACKNKLTDIVLDIDSRFATTVMLVSGGYPEKYDKGMVVKGLEDVEESIVFHAGTVQQTGEIKTNGGRVLAMTSFGNTIEEALKKSYASVSKTKFDKMNFRKDIGKDLINS